MKITHDPELKVHIPKISATTSILYLPPSTLKPNPLNKQIYQDPEDPVFDDDIKQNGIREPIRITEDKTIIDGHRRWKRAQIFKMPTVPTQVRNCLNLKIAMVMANRYRKKTDWELMQEAKILAEELKPQARERQRLGAKLPSNLTERGETREKVARVIGVSTGKLSTLQKVGRAIEELADKPEVQQVRQSLQRGEVSAHQAAKRIEQIQAPQPVKAPPKRVDAGETPPCSECGLRFRIIHLDGERHLFEKIVEA